MDGYEGQYCDNAVTPAPETTVPETTTPFVPETTTPQAPVTTTPEDPIVTTTPSLPESTLPPAIAPPQCPPHPTPPSENKQVSFAYITTVSNLIRDDIRNKGNCLAVIHQRIYKRVLKPILEI